MAVRKRRWTTADGEKHEAWVAFYRDGKSRRRQKTFAKKRDAEDYAHATHVEVARGTHVAPSASISIAKAGELWIASAKARNLTQSTIDQYQQHLDLHIAPYLGRLRVSAFTLARTREFEDELRSAARSAALTKKVLVSLSSLLSDAQERGHAARNVMRDRARTRKAKDRTERKPKLRVGIDLPTRDEIRAFVGALEGTWRAALLCTVFTGLRASELRGLKWVDLDLERKTLRVAQRADAYGEIDLPKSVAGERTIPLPPMVVNALRTWKETCPKSKLGLVFPNARGGVVSHKQVREALIAAWIKAEITAPSGKLDKDGAPILTAKYTGLHSLRHWFASWCLNAPAAGGLGLTLKEVQERLGHASARLTMDTYSHLFEREDGGEQMAAAERALFG